MMMQKLDGLSTLKALKQNPELRRIPVVIITAFGGSEQTIEGMKAGAYDYITKPFDPDEVLRTAARAIEVNQLSREVEQLRARAEADDPDASGGLIGQHPAMREVFKLIEGRTDRSQRSDRRRVGHGQGVDCPSDSSA